MCIELAPLDDQTQSRIRVPSSGTLAGRVDTLSSQERSGRMRLVRSKDTMPELAVRRWLHARGYRYRLHVPTLPGKPDIVFPTRRKVIFVHGCFWHRHEGCRLATMPKSRIDFWQAKLAANRARDTAKLRALAEAGWTSMVVWQCELRDMDTVGGRIIEFLTP